MYKINRESAVPVYVQIVQMIKLELLSGRINNQDTLPTIKELSNVLGVHPNTIIKAYDSLRSEGLIDGKPGSRYWATSSNSAVSSSLTHELLLQKFKEFIDFAIAAGVNKEGVKKLINEYLDGEKSHGKHHRCNEPNSKNRK